MTDRRKIGMNDRGEHTMSVTGGEEQHRLASILLTLHDRTKPFHEFLQGQRQLFCDQGYTDDEARAMSASLFVSMFGSSISRIIAEEE